MAKFMYVFRGGGGATPGLSAAELRAHMQRWYAWQEELARAGHAPRGKPVENRGKLVRDRVVTDGPFIESKDLVTGSMIIEAASLDEAAELARTCPVFEFGGTVEVRPVAAYPSDG